MVEDRFFKPLGESEVFPATKASLTARNLFQLLHLYYSTWPTGEDPALDVLEPTVAWLFLTGGWVADLALSIVTDTLFLPWDAGWLGDDAEGD